MQTTRFSPGFSLVELMIVLVIASILGAVAYPSYRDHLMRTAIPEATGGLSLYSARLEEYYLDHRSYAGSSGACALPSPGTQRFSFSCEAKNNGQSYLLTASGVSGDLASFSFTLDQNGNEQTIHLPAGWGNVPANCWIQKRQASC